MTILLIKAKRLLCSSNSTVYDVNNESFPASVPRFMTSATSHVSEGFPPQFMTSATRHVSEGFPPQFVFIITSCNKMTKYELSMVKTNSQVINSYA